MWFAYIFTAILFGIPTSHGLAGDEFSQPFSRVDEVQLGDSASLGSLNLTIRSIEPVEGLRLFSRQQTRCQDAGYIPCPDKNGCCPSGSDCTPNQCCPADYQDCGSRNCYNPETQQCCQRNGQAWACPRGQKCCSTGYCYDPKSERCCDNGSCEKEMSCCENECCSSIATCGSNGYCAPKITAAPKPDPATEDLPAQATTQTIRFVYDGERMETVKEGKYTGEKYKAPPKAVMQNMCEGIKKLTGSYSDKATLTKASNKQRRRNRRKMCTKNGKSVCTNAVNEYIEKFYPDGKIPEKAREAIASATDLQCDEEGGSLESGTTICVPSTDNGWQGTTMSPFFRGANKIKSNERFTIELVGWDCEKQAPKASSRREFNLNATVTGSDAYRGFDPENPKLKALIMPLGDLDAGSYSINLTTVSGTVNASIRTYDGESYETTQGPHGEMLFTLPEDEFAVSLVGTTMDDDVKVTYEAKQVKTSPSTSTTTSPTQSTPTQNLALMNSPVMKGGLVFWWVVFGFMAVL